MPGREPFSTSRLFLKSNCIHWVRTFPVTTWIMVRVSKETHKLLCDVRNSLLRAAEQGQVGLDLNHYDHVSLDQVIVRLVEARLRHAERRTAALARRRKLAKERRLQRGKRIAG